MQNDSESAPLQELIDDNSEEEGNDTHESGERVPLLDITGDIERPSVQWGMDPVSDYDQEEKTSVPTT